MPEHTSFFSYLIAMFPALGENMKGLGHTLSGKPLGAHHAEPLVASLFIVILIIGLAFAAKPKIMDYKNSVIPDEKLTLRTFFELVIGMFYNMMKDMMGPKRAKRFFPIIGTAALFILFSNYLGMIPGILPPTANLRITIGMGFVVFLAFNYYGIKENGAGYFTHLFGPWLGPAGIPINILIFGVEVFSLCMRPLTLGMRLFMNIAVDHLLLSIFVGLIWFLVPVPIMLLGALVCIVQVIVFCLLSSIFIALATEHADHGPAAHGKEGHGKEAAAH
ncbi:MAG: F0F1 ATP synthase subunit A [Polyangiaceae bacterium]